MTQTLRKRAETAPAIARKQWRAAAPTGDEFPERYSRPHPSPLFPDWISEMR